MYWLIVTLVAVVVIIILGCFSDESEKKESSRRTVADDPFSRPGNSNGRHRSNGNRPPGEGR